MNDPAPFRLSLPQSQRLKRGVVACGLLAGLAYVAGVAFAVATGDARQLANASLAGSILFGLFGLGLYLRRALGLAHQRQITALAWLTDPHTAEVEQLDPEQLDAEIPSPRPSVDPEPSREDDRE